VSGVLPTPTSNDENLQYRQGVELLHVVDSPPSPTLAVEELQPHHYWEIADPDNQVPPVDDSSESERKAPYDHLGHVPRRTSLPAPVYLQLVSGDNTVEDEDVSATSQTGTQAQVVMPVSQPVSTDAEPVPDLVL